MKSVFRTDLLDGKIAFITGGGSGICQGIARGLMAHGAHAAIVSRKQERLDVAARELEGATGRTCLPVAADVRDPKLVEQALDRCIERFGTIDILVNGAAGNFLAPAAQLSYNGFKTVLEIDAIGTYNVCKAAFDRALSKRGGTILNISATLHYSATPMQIHASAAKAAVDSITRSLALEWGPLGIRVNGIAPGPIEGTEGITRLLPPEMKDKLVAAVPLRRMGTIDEIANIAVFLASDAASLIHGETLIADGGAWLSAASQRLMA